MPKENAESGIVLSSYVSHMLARHSFAEAQSRRVPKLRGYGIHEERQTNIVQIDPNACSQFERRMAAKDEYGQSL